MVGAAVVVGFFVVVGRLVVVGLRVVGRAVVTGAAVVGATVVASVVVVVASVVVVAASVAGGVVVAMTVDAVTGAKELLVEVPRTDGSASITLSSDATSDRSRVNPRKRRLPASTTSIAVNMTSDRR